MKPNDTVTLIVTRNYGRPHTWSLPTWKVYAGSVAGATLVGLLMLLGLAFLVLYPSYQQQRHNLQELERERDALRQQVLSANQENYHAKEQGSTAEETASASAQPQDVIPTSMADAEAYLPPLRIGGLNTRVTRNHLEFSFQLTSTDKGRGNRGGFVFTVFENQDVQPTQYLITPTASINEGGFPQFYKEGLIFPFVRDTVSIRRSVKLDTPDTYFTHVTIYLFSPRGGLIAKERFTLDRTVFQQDAGGEPRKPSKA
ncbi:MAG TPA: hypothetical protein VF678_03560 [bacterium]